MEDEIRGSRSTHWSDDQHINILLSNVRLKCRPTPEDNIKIDVKRNVSGKYGLESSRSK